MKKDDINDLIKDLNTYHEEKERKYFERNLIKQKLGKYLFIFLILLIVLGYVLYTLLSQEKPIENTSLLNNFITNGIISV